MKKCMKATFFLSTNKSTYQQNDKVTNKSIMKSHRQLRRYLEQSTLHSCVFIRKK
jgi:hypothetical protein